MRVQTFLFIWAGFLIYRDTQGRTRTLLHFCEPGLPFLGATRREKHLDTKRGTETLEHSSRCIKASYAGLIPWISQTMEQIKDLKTTKMDAWLEQMHDCWPNLSWAVVGGWFQAQKSVPTPMMTLMTCGKWHLSSSPVVGTRSITRGTFSLPEPRFTHIWKNGENIYLMKSENQSTVQAVKDQMRMRYSSAPNCPYLFRIKTF